MRKCTYAQMGPRCKVRGGSKSFRESAATSTLSYLAPPLTPPVSLHPPRPRLTLSNIVSSGVYQVLALASPNLLSPALVMVTA